MKLTQRQRQALLGALHGPLFRNRSGWSRPSAPMIPPQTVEALLSAGLFVRSHTRHGVPMVVMTDAGRAVTAHTCRLAAYTALHTIRRREGIDP